MMEDAELLRRYAEDRAEAAFAELVRRRVDLVFAVARRQCGGDAHMAEEVTQRVFADLARKAKTLAGRTVISGWLYRSVHFAASDAVRAERRRRARDQEDFLMKATTTGLRGGHDGEDGVEVEALRPVLDAALGELQEADRDAVALRFLEERSWAEVAGALGLSEDAARKRVARALDKLEGLLARRGITSTAAALGVALSGQVGVAAPSGLAASVTARALVGASVAGGVGVVGSFLVFMSTAKIVGVIAVVASGVALFEWRARRETREELAGARAEQFELGAKIRALERQVMVQTERAAAAEEDTTKLLSAVQRLRLPSPGTEETTGPITRELVESRYQRAQELARNGRPSEALTDFLWCFDEGMIRLPSFTAVRTSFLLMEVTRLGSKYPPALDALRTRRDAVEQKMAASVTDIDAAMVFASLNSALKEDRRTLAVYDRLERTDQRRTVLGPAAFELLAEAGRYGDAALAKTSVQMKYEFDSATEAINGVEKSTRNDEIERALRTHAVDGAVKNIEVLAGAGDMERAREMIARLLVYDGGTGTKEKLRQRLVKVGRLELMPAGPGR